MDWVGTRVERVPPPVFCKRVRNELIWNELREYSFWKSAQEIETEGVNFCRFVQKSEKEREEGTAKTDRLLFLATGDGLWVARREVGGYGRWMAGFGREIGDENMWNFTTNIHAVSNKILVTIRIEAEVIEHIYVGIVEISARRRGSKKVQEDRVWPTAWERKVKTRTL